MKIVVTGGAGFIGSHLVRYWLGRGAHVTVVDSFRSGKRENLAGLDVELVEASVEKDADALEHAFANADHVYHLAALVSVPESVEQPAVCERINTIGTINVLEAARRANAGKVVFASSSAVYGSVERPIHSEDDAPSPESPYALSKLAGEYYMRLYREHYKLPTVALRFFNVFGPRQDPNSPYAAAVAIFMDRARTNKPLTIYGDGEQTRDFIFVEDVVRALVAAAEKGDSVYNVSCGRSLTVNELAHSIIRTTGSLSEIKYEPPRPGDVKHSRGNNARLTQLGWKPEVELEDGLRQLAES